MTEEQIVHNEGEEDFRRAGQVLAEARVAQGLSLDEISERLKISSTYLKAIEACDYEQLPGTTFIRGYLRAYARLVNEDEEKILSLYGETIRADEHVQRLLQERPLDQPSTGGKWLAITSLLVLAGFICFSVYWWLNNGQQDSYVTDPPASSLSAPENTPTAVDVLVQSERSAARPEPTEPQSAVIAAGKPVEQAPAIAETPEPAPVVPVVKNPAESAGQQPEPLVATAEDSLLVRFSEDCWVEVRDVHDNVLFSDMKRAGSELQLTGDAPLKITFGNAASVAEVHFNGEVIHPRMRVSSANVGRLNLG